jgi:PAS domain S-box-containing protein
VNCPAPRCPGASSRRQYAFVLEQLPHPVVVTDIQNRIVGWNQLAEDAFGFTKGEICGRSPTLVYAPDRDPTPGRFDIETSTAVGSMVKTR